MFDFETMKKQIKDFQENSSFGEIEMVTENMIISKGPVCKIGDLCSVGKDKVPCEVIGLKGSNVYLMPLYDLDKLSIKDRVEVAIKQVKIPGPNFLLGRTLNALGETIDNKGEVHGEKKEVPLNRKPPNAMLRTSIKNPLITGVKSIDSTTTIGEGQKIGIFAGTGVGKSTLLGMIARNAKADVNVIALIGERGREVKEFIERDLGEEGLRRSVVVVATSDEQPLMQIKAAQLATSIAEEFREQGKSVMLMMDSITRFAMARRKIDNALNQPTIQGKTPSMEPYMQRILERSGTSEKGSITGIYTVLVEGDDFEGAIPDTARGILDGHIVLERKLAQKEHFPAVNVLESISRVMDKVVTKEHWSFAREMKKYMAIYQENEDKIDIGMYLKGQNPEIDRSIELKDRINEFLKQDVDESYEFEDTLEMLGGILD